MRDPALQGKLNSPCPRCKATTQHEVLRSEAERGSTEHVDWFQTEYQIVRCMGCRNTCFREVAASSEDVELDGKPTEYITIYPNPAKRTAGIDIWKLPAKVRMLYEETLSAFNAGAAVLSAAGLRSVVEAACLDQGCKGRSLILQIDDLVKKGIFLKRDADYLHQHRFLGNEAVHEMQAPPLEEFALALKILEHLLTTLYVMPDLDQQLKSMRAARGAKTQ